MTETWLDWATDDPAPGNCGYSALNIPCELVDPTLRRGVVVHSYEGWCSMSNPPSAVMRARGNSWGVTIMQSGAVWKHRSRPTFVNWHAGGPAQNIGTDGIEMEGKGPWTDAQKPSLVRVLREYQAWFGWSSYTVAAPTDKTQAGIRHGLLMRGSGSLWEHGWLDYTSCPSGRNDYGWLMPALEEDDMKMRFVKGPKGPEWATGGVHKIGIGSNQVKTDLINLGLMEPRQGVPLEHQWDPYPVTQAFLNALIDHAADIDAVKVKIAQVGGGGSLTEARLIAILNRIGVKVLG